MTESLDQLGVHFPTIHDELLDIFVRLEAHYRDMLDTEFTIEQGKLWMLQTRDGKRTARSAVRIAVEMANEGLISKREAVARELGETSIALPLRPWVTTTMPTLTKATPGGGSAPCRAGHAVRRPWDGVRDPRPWVFHHAGLWSSKKVTRA